MGRLRLGLLIVSLGACQGTVTTGRGGSDGGSTSGRDGGGAGVDGGAGADGGAGGSDAGGDPVDSGGAPPFDAGPCEGSSLLDLLAVTSLSGASPSGQPFAAPNDSNGAVVAWAGGSAVTLQRVGGDGAAAGAPVTVAGNGLYGLDVAPSGWGVLVSRGSDALYIVVVDASGGTVFEERLLGEVDHEVTNNEWFGTLLRYGRLSWTGSEWAAYYTVNRLWPDGIAHYGDQLRLFGPDGSAGSTLWDWGCSHSMEVRVRHNGSLLGPVCASDCYPSKGIHFNHRSAMLYPDEGGSNCAGGYGTSLGGLVPMPDGFWVTFTATDARASHDVGMVHVGNDRRAGDPIWLSTDAVRDANVHAERHGDGFVVAWTAGGTDRIARLDASGSVIEGPVDMPALGLAGASDFFPFSNGDVGWVTGTSLARLRICP